VHFAGELGQHQIFPRYCVSKIDSIVNSMEDASISLVDILLKHKLSK
jgi:biopolymer transport protein ExbB